MARMPTRGSAISRDAMGRANPITFFRETVSELRKSVWPSREETARLTIVVIAVSIAAGFFLVGLDRLVAETFGRFVLGI